MTALPYTDAPSPDITLQEYLQRLRRQGFIIGAEVAHLERQCRDGDIEPKPDIPAGTYILADPSGHYFVETAAGPVSAENYICHMRSRAERLDYLAARDLSPYRGRQPAAVPGVTEETHEACKTPEDAPAASPATLPPPVLPAPVSLEDRVLARLTEKLKRDQARDWVWPAYTYEAVFLRAYPGLTERVFDEMWREATSAPGVEKINLGRRKSTAPPGVKKPVRSRRPRKK